MYNNKYQTKPREWEVKLLPTPHSPLPVAFTLIELLVVMTIMVMLVAASIPLLKPMFESQKTKNAAQTVAAALQRVRFKAIEEQKSYGIQFVPFETNNNVALQMRLVKQASNLLNSENYRVRVDGGTIHFYAFNMANSAWDIPATAPDWSTKVKPGYKVQFDRQGRWYELDSLQNTKLAFPYDNLTLPEDPNSPNAMEYKVIQSPRPALTPPVVLPRGTVVDLPFSEGYANMTPVPLDKIMFTPNGDVDYVDGNNYKKFYGGLIYFCIGDWDHASGNPAAEDGKNNIETMTNFWVTLNPRTGAVRITEMAPAANAADIQGARKFAADNFGISE